STATATWSLTSTRAWTWSGTSEPAGSREGSANVRADRPFERGSGTQRTSAGQGRREALAPREPPGAVGAHPHARGRHARAHLHREPGRGPHRDPDPPHRLVGNSPAGHHPYGHTPQAALRLALARAVPQTTGPRRVHLRLASLGRLRVPRPGA